MRKRRLREEQPLGRDTAWVDVTAEAGDLARISPRGKSDPVPTFRGSVSPGRDRHGHNCNLIEGVSTRQCGDAEGMGAGGVTGNNNITVIRSGAPVPGASHVTLATILQATSLVVPILQARLRKLSRWSRASQV